jgi:DNA repair ATPase RecN
MKTCDEKDKIVSKTLRELKEIIENCDTFERQNTKLQVDLTLALEKLEEMTEEAERFAQESLNSQKQLADSEQKREEFKIQAQETIKQLNYILFLFILINNNLFRWNARVKKLEKDIDRYKLDSTQMLEKNQQLTKEIENFKSQNFTLKEEISKVQTDLNESNVCKFIKFISKILIRLILDKL